MSENKIVCQVCGEEVHAIIKHLKDAHPEMTIVQYQEQFPDAPIWSEVAKARLEQIEKERGLIVNMHGVVTRLPVAERKDHFHKIFGLGDIREAKSANGNPIPLTVLGHGNYQDLVPERDPDYVFDVNLLKSVSFAIEENIPCYLWGNHGTGKCLGRGTPVLMFNGDVKLVEDVMVGDLLMGPDSFPRKVVSLARGREMMYKIVPKKGDSYVVNESHILSLKAVDTKGVINISVKDYLAKNKTFKERTKGWRTGVDFDTNRISLPVEPYFLGIWLGDGCSTRPQVYTPDEEIKQYMREYANRINLEMDERYLNPNNNVGTCCIVKRGGARHAHPLLAFFRDYNLFNNKHIPLIYKTSTRMQRLELLAGIIDTDGHLNGGAVYEVTFVSEKLADDTVFLARSLGFAAYKRVKVVNGKNYYRFFISGDLDLIPCKVPRKVAPMRKQEKNHLVVGIDVVKIGEGDYYGFELSGPDRLFLLGDFTVTHNTTVVEQVAHYLNRPLYRIQHSINMVESDVVGDWRAKDGNTYFDLGPLPAAMMHGWVFLADEYDRAPPGVLSLYQAVLEGKALVIKEAPPELRVIQPHKNFRFVATGNTNGTSDETGLYAGTLIQDAANLSRFGITEKVPYMSSKSEIALLVSKTQVKDGHAEGLVRWANMVREGFDSNKIGATVSPRELIYAARIGAAFNDAKKGIKLAITNRYSSVDRETALELAQRIFS